MSAEAAFFGQKLSMVTVTELSFSDDNVENDVSCRLALLEYDVNRNEGKTGLKERVKKGGRACERNGGSNTSRAKGKRRCLE